MQLNQQLTSGCRSATSAIVGARAAEIESPGCGKLGRNQINGAHPEMSVKRSANATAQVAEVTRSLVMTAKIVAAQPAGGAPRRHADAACVPAVGKLQSVASLAAERRGDTSRFSMRAIMS